MEPLSPEWKLWAIVNGVPAMVGGVLFLVAPMLRRIAPGLPDGIGHFDERFAWNIAARRDAQLLGVGYVFRGLLFLHIWLATTWAEIRWITFGNAAFAAVLLVVTMVWGDHLHWRRPSAIGWLFLYIEEPIWMLTLVAGETANAPLLSTTPGLSVLPIAALLVEAVLSLVAAGWFFFRRPTPSDQVSSRVLAGFFLGWTAWSLALARAATWEDAVWGLALNVLWLVGITAVFLLNRSRRPANARSP